MTDAFIDWFFTTFLATLAIMLLVTVITGAWSIFGPVALTFLVVPLTTFLLTVGRCAEFRNLLRYLRGDERQGP